MSTMISEFYDALISAGADEQKAKKAAEVLSKERLATKEDISKLRFGQFIIITVCAAGFGYVVSLLNTIITKI